MEDKMHPNFLHNKKKKQKRQRPNCLLEEEGENDPAGLQFGVKWDFTFSYKEKVNSSLRSGFCYE